MFESTFKSAEQIDAEAALGRSPGQVAALRLAALLLVANVFLVLILRLVLTAERMPFLNIVIALATAYYLYKLRPRAEALALGLTLLASVVTPLLYFWRLPIAEALIESIAVWGATGPLLLLLIGDPGRGRRIAAVVIFCVLRIGLYALATAGQLLG